MVRGLEKFREYFEEFSNQYVMIGGAACNILFAQKNVNFRATRDIDMVLIVEAQTREFGEQFWEFIQNGGYENRIKSNGKPQFYRFDKPRNVEYPQMIELFARIEGIIDDAYLTPVHIDDSISSLSAILLNKEYYEILLAGRSVVNGISVLKPTYLIPFKAKAWLDLNEKNKNGIHVDSRDIKKHKNDIFHMAVELVLEENIILPNEVRQDMKLFIENMKNEVIDMRNLGFRGIEKGDVVGLLEKIYS